MMNISIEEIISIVSLQLGKKNVVENHRLIEDLDAESADIANIIATVEEKYQLFISEEMIAKIRSVKDIHLTVTKHLSDNQET